MNRSDSFAELTAAHKRANEAPAAAADVRHPDTGNLPGTSGAEKSLSVHHSPLRPDRPGGRVRLLRVLRGRGLS